MNTNIAFVAGFTVLIICLIVALKIAKALEKRSLGRMSSKWEQ